MIANYLMVNYNYTHDKLNLYGKVSNNQNNFFFKNTISLALKIQLLLVGIVFFSLFAFGWGSILTYYSFSILETQEESPHLLETISLTLYQFLLAVSYFTLEGFAKVEEDPLPKFQS